MLENLYTTKMSTNKKSLQNRFAKIRSKSGRLSKIFAAVMSCAVAVAMLGATIVMAAFDSVDKKVHFFFNDKSIEFSHEPFFYKNTVYLPLRELFQRLGIFNDKENKITWDNGKIFIYLKGHSDYYEINIGDNKIIYDTYSHAVNSYAVLEEANSPVLMNDTAYIPFEYINYILNRFDNYYNVYYSFADINSRDAYLENAEELTYTDICSLQYRVDNGHFPWRLDPQSVIKAVLGNKLNDADGNGEIINLAGDGTKCAADYILNGTTYTAELFKPVQKDEYGIWVLKSFEKRG